MPLMIGLNIGRIFAVLFFLLASEGRLCRSIPVSSPGGATSSPAWRRAAAVARPMMREPDGPM